MKKEKRILYRIAVLLLGGLALIALATDGTGTIPDAYRQFFGLTSTNTVLDLDSDSLNNLQESVLWTDPFAADTDRDGWNDNVDSNALSRAVFLWGDAQFTSNDLYRYTFPAWCDSGFKTDGSWTTNGWNADSSLSNNIGALNIQVSRELLTNNAMLDVELFDSVDASLFVALCDSNQEIIVSNLYGQSIVTGSQAVVTRRLSIPFSGYTNACIVRLWRGTGEITVRSSLMYIDNDGDGLDADQEQQAGTSDANADSDGDGLSDWAELFVTHTNPLNADSDNDGYSDYAEVLAGSDPNRLLSLPVSSVSVFGTVYYSGSETGSIRVIADTYSGNWNSALYQEIATPGAYSLTPVPVLSNLWIRAWRDADGNGLCEPWEARGEHELNPRYFTHPVSNVDVTLSDYRQNYSLPFTETFEAISGMAGVPGNLNGQHGWNVSGTGSATVQSNTVSGGTQALQVTDASASHQFANGETNVWVSYRLKAGRGSAPQDIPTNMAVVFYVNTSGNLCVYSNQQSVTLPVTVADGWNRYDFHCDFTAKRWDLRFNRTQVVSSFPFYGSPDAFSLLRLDGKANGTCMDDVQVVFENPDRDNDGYSNQEETQAGSNPDDAQDVPGLTVSGQIIYSGPQAGAIHVIATTEAGSWNALKQTVQSAPGTYSLLNVPDQSNVWIKAWRDSNTNGLCDSWEAQGVYGTNALHLTSGISNINITLSDPDSDGDTLPDWRELELGTNPHLADTDGDGLSDAAEIGSVYRVVEGAFTWDDAKVDAETRGGHLFTLSSEAEHQALVGFVGESVFTNANYWIGAFRSDTNSAWQWATGEGFLFSRWSNLAMTGELWAHYDKWRNQKWSNTKVYGGGCGYILEIENFSNPLLADTDGDGLSDSVELQSGCNARIADSDGDGLSDSDEIAQGMNPLSHMLVGGGSVNPPVGVALTEVQAVNGSAVSSSIGSWAVNGSALYAVGRRGGLTYQVTVPQGDIYRLELTIRQQKISVEKYNYTLRIAVDGEYIERIGTTLSNQTRQVSADTPFLNAGQHTVEVFWDNYQNDISLRVEQLSVQQYSGMDGNSNGIKDWVENRLMTRNTVDTAPGESRTSPVCLEGRGLYTGAMQVSSANTVSHGANDRWFADVSLPENGTLTNILFSFENRGVVLSRPVSWKPTNLLTDLQSNEVIRRGDALRLTAFLPGMVSGTAQIKVNGQSLGTCALNDALVYRFDQDGLYTLEGITAGTDGQGNPVNQSRSVQVQVIGSSPATVAAQVNQLRNWVMAGRTPEMKLQMDSRLTSTDNGSVLTLTATVPEELYGVVRLGATGPVLAPVTVKGFNMWFMYQTYLHYSEIYADGSFKAETTMIMSPLIPEVRVEQSSRGVVAYEDGSRNRTFTVGSFNALGEVVIVFCHSSPFAQSVCHYTEVYQGDEFVSRAY
jgi:hypothetical protein